jgi:hypothetical protein
VREKATPTFSVWVPLIDNEPPELGVALIVTLTLAAFAVATSVDTALFTSDPVSIFAQDIIREARDIPMIAACAPRVILAVFLVFVMISPTISRLLR